MGLKTTGKRSRGLVIYSKPFKYEFQINDKSRYLKSMPDALTVGKAVSQNFHIVVINGGSPVAEGSPVEVFAEEHDLTGALNIVLKLLREECPSGTEISTKLDSDRNGEGDWIRVDVCVPEGQEWVHLYDGFLARRMRAPLEPRTDSLIRVIFE